jgi:eukaryotic-like serine/threonine-protein kinase
MLDGTEGDFEGTARFNILRRIGAGGMGVVYEAFDRERNCRVALKTLRQPGGEELLRLKTEFRALQDVQHRNLVSLGELREERGAWFFTMELVDGVSFLEWARPASGAPVTQSSSSGRRPGDSSEPLATARTWRSSAAQRLWDSTVGAPACDEQHLREALGQLAAGVCALHAAGKVHRDIKPSNVLVTPEGRVVLLDFGLVTGTALDERSSVAHPVGTVAYMAPEQAASRPVGPAADWYAVGVMLFQALTGALPFDGAPIEVMVQKQDRDGSPPRALAPEAPADLDDLCRDLLRCDPAARPTGTAVLDRLGVAATASARLQAVARPAARPIFVGRRAELEVLRGAFEAACRGTPQSVLVGGESGVGKTALVRWFSDRLREEVPGVVVLSGRCYEREYVPYRAIDGVIDALSHFMVQLGEAEAGAMLPRAAGLLGQVFPVLRRVKAVAQAPRPDAGIDPQELRRLLFGAVRELLVRLADRHPVVITIDDLQWVDADSLALATEVVRPPDAPGLLILGTRRDQPDDATSSRAPALALLQSFTRQVSLGPLPQEEARVLAARLAERLTDALPVPVDSIAAEAGGHPLFIDELVRHAAAVPGAAGAVLRLDDVLRARVAGLPAASRRVMELVAVAGPPTAQGVVERAAELGADDFRRCVAALRAVNLVVTTGARQTDTIAPYHDRVRESLLAALPDARIESLHRDLALAYEASDRADPEQLAVHWQGAGEDERSAGYYLQAAIQSEAALAFEHAAHMYQAALDLQPTGRNARQTRVRLGHALANAGRGALAAERFLHAAAGAPPVEALELTRRAAEQYLRSGHIDEGLQAIRGVLPAFGLSFPRTPRRAQLSALWQRVRLRLRGLGFQTRNESQIAPEVLAWLDAAFSIADTLGLFDVVRGTDFNARLLLAALRVGEPQRLLRALSIEAVFFASSGRPRGERRSRRLLALADGLVGPSSDELTRAYPRLAEGMSLYFMGRFREALGVLQACEEQLRTRCHGGDWERDQTIVYALFAQYYLGQIREVATRVPQHVAEGLHRGDLYLTTVLSLSLLNSAWLVDDDPATARSMAADAIARWSFQGSVVHSWYAPTALAQLKLYEGDGAAALEHVERAWPGLERSLLLRVGLVNVEAHHLRARVALATAAGGGADREQHRRAAARDAAWLRRRSAPWTRALGALTLAGVEACGGRAEHAVALLAEAERGFDELHLALHAAAARRRRGALVGGDEGRALLAAADEWMAGQRIKNPARMTAMIAPGFAE